MAFHEFELPPDGSGFPAVVEVPPRRRLRPPARGAVDNPLWAAVSKMEASLAQGDLVSICWMSSSVQSGGFFSFQKSLAQADAAAAPPSPKPIRIALRLVIIACLGVASPMYVTLLYSPRRLRQA